MDDAVLAALGGRQSNFWGVVMTSTQHKESAMNRSIRLSRGLVFVFLAILVLAASSVPSRAQTFRGAILGTVTDSSGSAVGGATVQVKNSGTGLTRTVTTSDDGTYSVPELPIGAYTITVEKTGFKTGIVSAIQVEVGSERRADVSLQP